MGLYQMITHRRLFQSLLLLSTSGAINRLSAQIDAGDAQALRCAKPIKVTNIKRLESVPAKDSVEACRALGLSISAANRKYPGKIDSAVVWRHDFPTLGTSNVNSVYQIGLYISLPQYVEVVVDRKTWATSVMPLER